MESIFHEKQEGSLCAQHCLNALLQGPYFTPVELGTLAQQMDEEERMRMAENGTESEEYRRFLQQPSGNMDDSGYFSVQVISSALKVWGLELVPYTSTELRAREAVNSPCSMQAFICHYKDHWFTIRRIRNQWFNLNSLLSKPELISDTYLSLFLAQLQQEGYSIFVVFGQLPECEADEVLELHPIAPTKLSMATDQLDIQQEDKDVQRAIELSLDGTTSPLMKKVFEESEEEVQLQKALRLSLEFSESDDEVDEDDDEAQLKKALALSLECKSNPPSVPSSPCVSQDEIRHLRAAFLDRTAQQKCSKASETT